MTIKDDGVGFSTQGLSRGHGLRNMEKRAQEIHAKYFLVSKQGKGTEVRLSKKMT
jgi:signal transduction histidine kinase